MLCLREEIIMAEYIDRDTAIRTAIEMCVKVVGDCITQIDAVEIANAFEDIPAGDVVPKSEVEELIRENESLAKTVNEASELIRKLRSKVKKSKSDVAREIFAEIEACMKDFEDDDDGYILKKCEFEFFMREIRDKYTESEND